MKPATKTLPGFSKKEVTGVITLLVIILLLYIAAHYTGYFVKQPASLNKQDSAWLLAAAHLKEQAPAGDSQNDYTANNLFDQVTPKSYFNTPGRTLFYFNPNELSAEGWQKLGIRPKTIRTIMNYRNKGGEFRKPEDLQKVYGLSQADYLALLPYVQIPAREKPVYPVTPDPQHASTNKPSYPAYTKKTYHTLDINKADTAEYSSLPGIGAALARRIVNFREKLGGFYRVEQVAETYGVPDSTFQKIKPYLAVNTNGIKKLNINTATAEVLAAHPYIKGSMAKSIVAFRQQHGLFHNIQELQKIMSIDNMVYEKIRWYVTTE